MAAAATLTYSKCTYCMYVYIHVRVYTHTQYFVLQYEGTSASSLIVPLLPGSLAGMC